MKHETKTFEGLSGKHHYCILNKRDVAELFKFGIICTEIEPTDSYYIVTEECWNEHFVEENDGAEK